MVRAGVVNHPSEWPFGGYNEIQKPRRKCVLIAYQKLAELSGFDSYDRFRDTHKEWVEELLRDGINSLQSEWTESIAACPACPMECKSYSIRACPMEYGVYSFGVRRYDCTGACPVESIIQLGLNSRTI